MSDAKPVNLRRHAWLSCTLLVVALIASQAVLAHGLLVSVRGDDSSVSGRVYYSNGDPGAGEWVQLFDLVESATPPLGINTSSDGSFRFPGVAGRRYRVSVTGEEGHAVDSEITLGPNARGRFVERDPSGDAQKAASPLWPPPAWAVIGGVLLLSMIPALWLRLRRRPQRGG